MFSQFFLVCSQIPPDLDPQFSIFQRGIPKFHWSRGGGGGLAERKTANPELAQRGREHGRRPRTTEEARHLRGGPAGEQQGARVIIKFRKIWVSSIGCH